MTRSRLPHSAGLLLGLALLAASSWPGTRADELQGMSLRPSYLLIAPARAPAALPETPPADGLRLKAARELGHPPAPANGDPLLSPALLRMLVAIALFLAANTSLLLLFSIVMRIWRERGQRRRDRFRARWEPVLHARMLGDAVALPPLAPSERLLFLNLWLHLLGYVRDEAAYALVQTARELGLPQYALRLLERGSPWKRIVAMRAVAALRLEQACDTLAAKARQNRQLASLTAVRALLEIDPERGFAELGYLLKHQQWSPAAMVEIVRAGGSATVHKLAALLRSVPPGQAKQMVRLIELLEDQSALPALRERLAASRDEEEIAAILHCLGRLGLGEDRATGLAFLEHDSWLVRMQAAYLLGTFGLAQDTARLAPLLRDRHWWVRYRSAQSLLRLAGAAALGAMRDGEADPYARDMLARVLAEGG
jgi:HEAT repeat protein